MARAKVTKSSKKIRSLYLGAGIVTELEIRKGETYPIHIEGVDLEDIRGTLTESFNLGGPNNWGQSKVKKVLT